MGQDTGGLEGSSPPARLGRPLHPDVEMALSKGYPAITLFGQPGESIRNPGIGLPVKGEEAIGGRGVQHSVDPNLKGSAAAAKLLPAEVVESVLGQDLGFSGFEGGRIGQGVPGQWPQGQAAGLPSQPLHKRFQFDRRAGCGSRQGQSQQHQHEQWLHTSILFQFQVRPTERSRPQRQPQPPPSARGAPGACRPPASERCS